MGGTFQIIKSTVASRQEFTVRDGTRNTHGIFYLKEGHFRLEIDGITQEIRAGDCVILPRAVHFRRNVVSPIVFVYIKFAQLPGAEPSPPIPHGKIRFKDRARFLSTIDAMESLLDRTDPLAESYREHLLYDILFQAWQEKESASDKTSGDPMVDSAIAYIGENLEKKLRLNNLCSALGTNPSTLNYRFRRTTGSSAGSFIQQEQMKRARQLRGRSAAKPAHSRLHRF